MITTNIPDLAGDEGILAEIPNIEVKSIEFRLFLTNKRLILIEDANRNKAPVVVPLQVIRNIGSGKNYSEDPVLKLSLSAPDGKQKNMILSFTQEFTGIRDKERDQLKKILEGVVSQSQMTVKTAPKPNFTEYPGQAGGFSHQGGYQLGQSAPFGNSAFSQGGVILTGANVVVKSQEYTATLTNEKIMLTDPNRPQKPSLIPLAAVRSAEGETGENGEPAIGLLVEAGDGNIRRMVLKFSQWYDKNRWGERETWVRAIQDILATGSVGELYRPSEADSIPQVSRVPDEGGFSARPPGMQGQSAVCPKCHTPVSPGMKFCGTCGFSIGDLSSGGIIDTDSFGRGNTGADLYGSGGASSSPYDDDMFGPSYAGGKAKRPVKAKKVKPKRAPKRKNSYDDDDFYGKRAGAPLFDQNSVIGRLLLFITSPSDAFQRTKGQDAVDAAPSLIISLLIFAIGNVIFLSWYASSLIASEYPVMSAFSDFGTAFFFVAELAVIIAVLTVIYGILLHLALVLTGYRSEINDGIRISLYSATAFIAGGIIPFAGLFIAPLWAFLLQIIGIRENFGASGMQALIAALIPAFIALVAFYMFISSGDSNFSIFGGA